MQFTKLSVIFLFVMLLLGACGDIPQDQTIASPLPTVKSVKETSLIILGTVQDAGSPQIACTKACCKGLFEHPDPKRLVVSLGLIDPSHQETYLFEATPDIGSQLKTLRKHAAFDQSETPDGVFLTHAHIGHYAGLMYFGKEAMNAKSIPVYAMPRMKGFLESNGPWDQLVNNQNIALSPLADAKPLQLNPSLQVIPFLVPHRDEYSETVGYTIIGPNKRALFIPDIDKWGKWNKSIIEEIAKVDYAFLDATFYDGEEINNRDISQIPHPFIIESMQQFKDLPSTEKAKIHFIHFNHTNPVLNADSKQVKHLISLGFHIAKMHDIIAL